MSNIEWEEGETGSFNYEWHEFTRMGKMEKRKWMGGALPDGKFQIEDFRWEMGDGRWEMGDGRWEMMDKGGWFGI
jgi:hypothetical protein